MKPTYNEILSNALGRDLEPNLEVYWRLLREADSEVHLDAVAVNGWHWWFVFPDVESLIQGADDENPAVASPELQFWRSYRDPVALNERRKAVHGLIWVNFSTARNLLDLALSADEHRAAAMDYARKRGGKDADVVRLAKDLTGVADRFIWYIKKREHSVFSALAILLRCGGIPHSEKPRGGTESELGKMLKAFCQLHIESGGLPTKKQLREAYGLGDTDPEIKRAGRLMKKLGLLGLPEARPSSS